MEARLKQLSQLHCYVQSADKEVTMILQNLQWDRIRLLEVLPMTICSYDRDHKLPQENLKTHEEQCFLKSQSYLKEDLLLPDPLDTNANTLVKLSTQEIMKIINDASIKDPLFKKGNVRRFTEPLSLERLQFTYTADERRAIHDAVVSTVPSCHDLADLALPSTDRDKGVKHKEKSRSEILAELRNMKRRRPKYRVAAKTRNYSDVLRDVIKTQMEFYSDAIVSEDMGCVISKEPHYREKNVAIQSETEENQHCNNETLKYCKNTDYETFASKNISRIEHSKRKTEDRRKRSYHYGSNRDEDERETKYKYSDGMESSTRNGKKRQDDYFKSNSYRNNRELHGRDKSKKVLNTRSNYRKKEKERGGNKNTDRESHGRYESASIEYSENCFSERDAYSKHHKRNRNRDYHDRKSERRRKHNDYYYYSFKDEAERGRDINVKKERLDTTDQENTTRSSRSDYYDSFNSNIQNKKVYCPIKVEKLEPEGGESAPSRDENNATNNSYNNNIRKIYIKREKESTDSESTDSDSSSSYSNSSNNTDTEEERSTREETDKPPSTKQRKAYGKYINTSNYQNAQPTNKHGRQSVVNKIETFEMEPRQKESRNVYSSSNTASNKANLPIKLEQIHSEQRQGRDGQAIHSKHTTIHTNKSEWSRELGEKHNHTNYYGGSTGSSRTRESSQYYSSSYREVKGYEKDFRRGIHVYNNDKAYSRHNTDHRERDVHDKRTHSRQS